MTKTAAAVGVAMILALSMASRDISGHFSTPSATFRSHALMLSFMMGLMKREVYQIACSAQAANSIPAMAPSAEARANQSRQNGGCGVLTSSSPHRQRSGYTISQVLEFPNTWIGTLSDLPMHFNSVLGREKRELRCRDH